MNIPSPSYSPSSSTPPSHLSLSLVEESKIFSKVKRLSKVNTFDLSLVFLIINPCQQKSAQELISFISCKKKENYVLPDSVPQIIDINTKRKIGICTQIMGISISIRMIEILIMLSVLV